MHLSRYLAFTAFSLLPFFSTVPAAQATTLYLKGDVVYRERMALPENAQIEVTLTDKSAQDQSSTVVATTTFTPTASTPFPYELKFDSEALKPGDTYELSARITVDGKLFFASKQNKTLFKGEEKDTTIFVMRASDSTPDEALNAAQNNKLPEGEWSIIAIQGKNVIERAPATLKIEENNRISGKSGCNSYGGGIKAEDDNKVSLSRMISTQMICDQDLMKQELDLFKAFGLITSYSVSNKELTFFDKDKKPVLKLSRKQ